jgi:hypothetical protein
MLIEYHGERDIPAQSESKSQTDYPTCRWQYSQQSLLMGRLDGGNLLGFLRILKYYLVWLHLSGGNPHSQLNVYYLPNLFCWECGFPSKEMGIHIPKGM